MAQQRSTYSIHEHFAGGAVLLTGGSGYVGALVLEKLLRCTNIDTVYVMLRPKKGEDISGRLNKMLTTNPLMHLLKGHPVLAKVRAVAGDMKAPGLGFSQYDVQLLQRKVHTVIHCAADIRLEVGIQELLQTNYNGLRQLLQLSRTFEHLSAFVHVSSAYTNMNAPPGSLVHESIYPLSFGDQPVSDADLVQELMSMPAHNANLRAEGLLAHWGFPNNYTLSKHLAEYMVADYQATLGLPVAIVRPTLISSVARDPYPGYTGNYAGHVGATLAFMAGLFDSPAASNYKASNVWDVIPSDVVAAVILAAAAAVGQGFAGACSVSPTYAQRPQQQRQQQGCGVDGSFTQLSGASAAEDCTAPPPLLIVHCGSSTTYPLTIVESWNWGVEAYGAWPNNPSLAWGKCAGPMPANYQPNPQRAARHMAATGWKIWAAAKLLGLFRMGGVARKLTIGFESFKVINQPKTDVNLRFSTANMQRLAALLHPAECGDFLLLWKPERSGSTPNRSFTCSRTPFALSVCGPVGSKGSFDATGPASAAAGAADFVIRAGLDAHNGGSDGSSDSSSNSSDTQPEAAQHHGAVLPAEAVEAVARMRAIPLDWRAFHINLGAFLYCCLFKMPLPANEATISKPEVIRWLNIRPEDRTIRHQFVIYQ